MVKPMPDSAAPPATRRNVSPGASCPMPIARSSAVAPVMPTNLPTTSPATTPQNSDERSAAAMVCPSRCTPALARANNGSTTNETQGANGLQPFVDRIDSRRLRVAASAYSEFGDCRKARITPTASSTRPRSGVNTGMNRATATPASVGWTPPTDRASHSANASTRTRGPGPGGRSRTAAIAAVSTVAINRGRYRTSSEQNSAIARSAPISSTTARVNRKVRNRAGYFGPMIARAPTRNAVSVEITTPQARASSPEGLNTRKFIAGTTARQTPAMTGTPHGHDR